MSDTTRKKAAVRQGNRQSDPQGKRNLISALRRLLEEKDFNAITTAEIAATAATNEALIYRYFGDKRGLLHKVLAEYLDETQDTIKSNLSAIDDPLKRLEQIIWHHLDVYNRHRVFAKIVLLEVRCFTGYFDSDVYGHVKSYARLMVDTIKEAMRAGEFRKDIKPTDIRDLIIGMIEQLTIPAVIFGRSMDPDACTKRICDLLLRGVAAPKSKRMQAKESETDAIVG